MHVIGRLCTSSLEFHVKHPVILPKYGHVTELLICYFRERIQHQGGGLTLNEIRENEYTGSLVVVL